MDFLTRFNAKVQRFGLPMFTLDDGGAGGGGSGGAGGGGQGGQGGQGGAGGAAGGAAGGSGGSGGQGGQGGGQGGQQGNTYNDEQVNALMLKERQKLLKELGLGEDDKTAKENAKKAKEYLDSQKSEAERNAAALKTAETAAAEAVAKANTLEATLAAITAGTKPEAAADVVALAMLQPGEKPIADKIKAVLEKYPQFKGAGGGTPPGKVLGGTGNDNTPDADREKAMYQRMGLPYPGK